jgi:hypothetical protein
MSAVRVWAITPNVVWFSSAFSGRYQDSNLKSATVLSSTSVTVCLLPIKMPLEVERSALLTGTSNMMSKVIFCIYVYRQWNLKEEQPARTFWRIRFVPKAMDSSEGSML